MIDPHEAEATLRRELEGVRPGHDAERTAVEFLERRIKSKEDVPMVEDSFAFALELLEKAGVGVAPGVDFGQAGKRAVRFSYASSEQNMREAARRLGEYLGRK